MPQDDAIFSDGGYSDRERWEQENQAAIAKATGKGKKFRRQRKQTAKEKRDASTRGHAVNAMVERLKKAGLQGLKHRPS